MSAVAVVIRLNFEVSSPPQSIFTILTPYINSQGAQTVAEEKP